MRPGLLMKVYIYKIGRELLTGIKRAIENTYHVEIGPTFSLSLLQLLMIRSDMLRDKGTRV